MVGLLRDQHEAARDAVEVAVAGDHAVVADVDCLEQRPAASIDELVEIRHRARLRNEHRMTDVVARWSADAGR